MGVMGVLRIRRTAQWSVDITCVPQYALYYSVIIAFKGDVYLNQILLFGIITLGVLVNS